MYNPIPVFLAKIGEYLVCLFLTITQHLGAAVNRVLLIKSMTLYNQILDNSESKTLGEKNASFLICSQNKR